MRSVNTGEIVLLARVLMTIAPPERLAAGTRILAEVEAASRHLQQTGRMRPFFGDGSLMSRCLSLAPPAEPSALDEDFLGALIAACHALRSHSQT